MESFGRYITREREFRHISRDEVATATRVAPHTIAALEEDRIEALPALTFVKGYLKAYAQYVGLDPNDTVLRFEEFLAAQDIDPAALEGGWDATGSQETAVEGRRNLFLILAAAAVLAVTIAVILVLRLA